MHFLRRPLPLVLATCAFFLGISHLPAANRTTSPGGPAPWAEYVRNGRYEEGQEYFRNAIVHECVEENSSSVKAISPLHTGYLVCRYYPTMEERIYSEADRNRLSGWLMKNREFNSRFLLALKPQDQPDRAFRILYQLLSFSSRAVKQFPELTIAFAVVWDGHEHEPKELVGSYRYYVQNARHMLLNLSDMPHQVIEHIIDTDRSLQERFWALKHYRGNREIGKLYDQIWKQENRMRPASRNNEQGQMVTRTPSLPEIRQHGGGARHAALFASEVGKAIGLPTVYISARTATGVEHAWVGYLNKNASGYLWDYATGRGAGDKIVTGRVKGFGQRDAGSPGLEHTLAVLKPAYESRRRARIWCDVASILLEADYPEKAREALFQSLNACAYDPSQWKTFAEIARATGLSSQQLKRAIDKFCANLEDFPTLAANAFETLINATDPSQTELRDQLYSHMADKFADDPSTLARIRLMHGRYAETTGRADRAVDIYVKGARESLQAVTPMLSLVDNAGRLLVERGATEKAIALHSQIFSELSAPTRRTTATVQTTWFQVGLRLAKLHALAGANDKHNKILNTLFKAQGGETTQLTDLKRTLGRAEYSRINTTRAPRQREL